MKVSFTACFLVMMLTVATAQKHPLTRSTSNHSLYIKSRTFEGVIFSKDYVPIISPIPNNTRRFTPTVEDIVHAEKLIRQDAKLNGKGKIWDIFICRHLKKYLRQYAGLILPNGQKVILVNLFWREDIIEDEKTHRQMPNIPSPQWKTSWYMVADGGHFYWGITVNLSVRQLFDFGENGLG